MSGRPRRVVVAPDKFKGSLSAGEVAGALARGLRRVPDVLVVEHPIADGGEGTVETVLAHGFRAHDVVVRGPLGAPVTATIGLSESGDTAVVEMASASGLARLGREPDVDTAWRASSYGLGQLVSAALDHGAARVIVGVGGSATTDGGAGALVALGARIRDADGEHVPPGGCGLADAQELDLTGLDPRLRRVEIVVACDVDNPLTGPMGAAAVYGPQKGATASAVVALDHALAGWADLVAAATGHDRRDEPGMGAAGGVAFGLAAVLGARLTPGIELLLDVTGFEQVVVGADLVLVGEGSLDAQSLHGKGPVGVARAAVRHRVPVVAVVGRSQVTREQAAAEGIVRVHALTDLEPDEGRSMNEARTLLEVAGHQVAEALPRRGLDKVVGSAGEAVADIPDGATLAVGGFGLCGIPSVLVDALLDSGRVDLETVSNNCGVDDWGLGKLLGSGRVRRVIASYVGENKEFARQYLAGELEVELTPQGTLAERMRAGGSGIPAFFTATGVGTQVAEGGLPWKYDRDGNVVVTSPAKEVRSFDTVEGEKKFVLEHAIIADFALVRAWKGDRHGNLIYRDSARNFNPLAAMCGRVTIAEVEQLVEPGELDPNEVHTPGVFVQRVVAMTPEQAADKRIEKRTTRGAPPPADPPKTPATEGGA